MTDPSDQPAPSAPSAPSEPAPYVADPTALAAELEHLKRTNQGLIRDLAAAGAQVDPMAVFQTRLEILMEALAPEGTLERLQLEVVFESRMAELMTNAQTEVARAKLTAAPPPGFAPGRGANGNGRPNRLHLPGH